MFRLTPPRARARGSADASLGDSAKKATRTAATACVVETRVLTGSRLSAPVVGWVGGDESTPPGSASSAGARVLSRRGGQRREALSGGVRLANAQWRSESESGRRRREEGGKERRERTRREAPCGVTSKTSSEAQRASD